MFPKYLHQTPETSPELARAQRTLTGLQASLLVAIFRTWHVKPCREKMPCLARPGRKPPRLNLRSAVATYWGLASPPAQAKVQERFLQLLYWRQRGYPAYEWLQGGMEHGQIADVFQDDFGDWCEKTGEKRCDSPSWIVAKLIRLDPPANREELAYCLEPLDTLSAARLGAAWLHLLTRVCQRVGIQLRGDQKILTVQFSSTVQPCRF